MLNAWGADSRGWCLCIIVKKDRTAMDNPKKRYSIGEMSVVTGFSISTLRYYDKEKILTPAVRN